MSPAKVVYSSAFLFWLCVRAVAAADASNSQEEQPESALQQSIRLQERVELIGQQLASLESEYGPFDIRLQETLSELVSTHIELGEFQQASTVLERNLQLIRVTEGPTSLEQLPMVSNLIANDIRQSDWESVTDRFEFVQWLVGQNGNPDPGLLLKARQDLALWNFANVYLLEPSQRIRALQDARQLVRENTDVAEDYYGEESLELIAWLYQEAVLQYQVVAALVADDELGVYARDEILLIEGRSAESYLREGLNLVKRIREVAELSGDLEAEAMAMTYEADFLMLLEIGTATRLYRQAMEKFAEAGLEEAQVEQFFQRPIVLPVAQFHTRLTDAIAYQEDAGFEIQAVEDDEPAVLDLGRFVAWSESLPFLRRPELPEFAADLDVELDYFEIVMDFTLNSNGKTRNPKIVESNTDRVRVRRDARYALRDMQFRPYFEEGRRRRTENLRITYQVLSD